MNTATTSSSTPAEPLDVQTRLYKLLAAASEIYLPTWENPLRLLVTGSRRWTDILTPAAVLSGLSAKCGPIRLVHGGAKGLDLATDSIAKTRPDWPDPVSIPGYWDKGRVGGLMRNEDMVDMGHDVCVGFPDRDSIGTPDCLDRSIAAGIPTYYVWNYELKPWIQQKERRRFKK